MQKQPFQCALVITVLMMLAGCAPVQTSTPTSQPTPVVLPSGSQTPGGDAAAQMSTPTLQPTPQPVSTSTPEPDNQIPQHEYEALLALDLDHVTQWVFDPEETGTPSVADLPPPCQWPGVTCTSGHVTRLEFSQKLSGELPPELGDLSELQVLDLRENRLTGPIPPELGNLTQLRELILHGNDLVGGIPTELCSLPQLQSLRLDGNKLSGEINPELANLPQLRLLYLQDNQLSGPIPAALGNFPQLQILFCQIHDCKCFQKFLQQNPSSNCNLCMQHKAQAL